MISSHEFSRIKRLPPYVFNITGDSYRMRAHRARNRKLTEGGPA